MAEAATTVQLVRNPCFSLKSHNRAAHGGPYAAPRAHFAVEPVAGSRLWDVPALILTLSPDPDPHPRLLSRLKKVSGGSIVGVCL